MEELKDIVDALHELDKKLGQISALSSERDKKIDQMYTVLITGNGVPSIKERVNRLEENMLDKATAKELEAKIDRLEEMLPEPKEWSRIKVWSDVSIWIVGAIALIVLGQVVPKILAWLAGL